MKSKIIDGLESERGAQNLSTSPSVSNVLASHHVPNTNSAQVNGTLFSGDCIVRSNTCKKNFQGWLGLLAGLERGGQRGQNPITIITKAG